MKAYKLTVYIIDHDKVGASGIKDVLENARYPNHCIAPFVDPEIGEHDIGEWHNDHPLNGQDRLQKLRELGQAPEQEVVQGTHCRYHVDCEAADAKRMEKNGTTAVHVDRRAFS